jgi:tetratricopeptide (TPR) repeat protein
LKKIRITLKPGITRSILSLGESSKAVECFHRAIECAIKAHSSNKDLAEIYNNLGVAYYEIEDYVKSAESR